MRRLDPFLVGIISALILGLILPVPATVRGGIGTLSDVAVGILFLLYGMRLRTSEIVTGLTNVKVQGLIAFFTYIFFPALGFALHPVLVPLAGDGFATGFFFLCLLPSTIQSSVTFTSIAKGDTAAALCAATVSNLVGMVITPALVVLFLHVGGSEASYTKILVQLLLPFILGQLLQRWAGDHLRRHPHLLKFYDQATIVLIVFSATLDSTAAGVWTGVHPLQLVLLVVVSALILAIVLPLTWWSAGKLGISRPGQVAVMMCGSKKSLSTGLPMAQALFPAAAIGPIAVPLIAFHQIQLIVCAMLASRLGREPQPQDLS